MSMSRLRLVSSFLHKKRLVLDQAALPYLITRDRNSSLCMKQLFHSRPSHMRLVDRQFYNSLIIKYECPHILAIAFLKSSSIVRPSARGQSQRSGHQTRLPYKGIVLHGRVQILLVRFRKWPFRIWTSKGQAWAGNLARHGQLPIKLHTQFGRSHCTFEKSTEERLRVFMGLFTGSSFWTNENVDWLEFVGSLTLTLIPKTSIFWHRHIFSEVGGSACSDEPFSWVPFLACLWVLLRFYKEVYHRYCVRFEVTFMHPWKSP